MNPVIFEQKFFDMAERFGISRLCREQNKEYDLQSMMLALQGVVCGTINKEPIDEEKLDELAREYANKVVPHAVGSKEWTTSYCSFRVGYRKAKEE